MLDPERLAKDDFLDYLYDEFLNESDNRTSVSQEMGNFLQKGFLAGYIRGWKEREETYPKKQEWEN